MNKITDKKRMKMSSILQAARDEFLSFGYIAANMDRISKAAKVTKQTVYRYFPSKAELFKSTLSYMGEHSHISYYEYLDLNDTEEALEKFALGFIKAHLTDEHIETYRLLLSECRNEPSIVSYFFEQGPDETKNKLTGFFTNKLKIDTPSTSINLWTAMLLSYRNRAMLNKDRPSKKTIEEHVKECNRWLLGSI